MVPITITAFGLAFLVVQADGATPTSYDVMGLIIVTIGVFMMNWFKEKPQRVCIMEDENLGDQVENTAAEDMLDESTEEIREHS